MSNVENIKGAQGDDHEFEISQMSWEGEAIGQTAHYRDFLAKFLNQDPETLSVIAEEQSVPNLGD